MKQCVACPIPEAVSECNAEGLPFISLKTLIELKLASGMTAAHRPRDFDDVIQLIRINKLGKEFNALLNPYVVTKFDEMWQAAQVNEDY